MRLNALRIVPILAIVAAACNHDKTKDDTDEDTDIVNIDDTDTETDTVVDTDDTDDTDTLVDTDTGIAPLTLADLAEGDLVITEFMADPAACADPNGEYVEVYYKGATAVDIKGLILTNKGLTSVTNPNTTIVQPGTYALLLRQPSAASCYGLTGDWNYATLTLADDGDSVQISYGATIFDKVDFSVGAWPVVTGGTSLGFYLDTPDAVLNDDPGNWCPSSDLDLLGSTQDHGSPRSPNSCQFQPPDTAATEAPADLMLTEVMDYGPNDGIRYIEIYNPNATPVSLDHWQVVVYNFGDPTRHVIPLTASGVLQPDHTWVLAAPSMTSPVLGDAASAAIDPLLVSSGCGADQYDPLVNGDGDDAVALAYNGFTVDMYGEPGARVVTAWEYGDKVAYRHDNLRSPSPVWNASEWTIIGTGHWNEASICRFDEPYVPPETVDTSDSFQDSTPLFTGDTFDTAIYDTDVPLVYDALTTLAPGELILDEVMFSPSCGDESQYLEVTLLANHNVSLNGLSLQIDANSFTFTDLLGLRPGESTLLWRTPNGLPDGNCFFGSLPDGLRYTGLNISHTGSLIKLKSGAVILDSVNTTGLRDRAGIAWQFDPAFLSGDLTLNPPGTVNNDIVNWCLSSDPIVGTSDFGTPLASNTCAAPMDTGDTDIIDTDVIDTDVVVPPKNVTDLVVGDLVITEFMSDPAAPCADENGEYIEVLNHSAFQVDLQGLVVSTGAGTGTVGSSLVVNAGAYAMVRRTPVATQCFGNGSAIPTTNYPANLALNQAGDFVSIGNGLTTLDLVNFAGWTPTSYSGEAWSLAAGSDTPTSNDTQANWCHSGIQIGSQNLGSPGQQLPCAP